jgi:hypothetical protein
MAGDGFAGIPEEQREDAGIVFVSILLGVKRESGATTASDEKG